MNLDQINKLIDAGFTAEDIKAMLPSGNENVISPPEPEPKDTPKAPAPPQGDVPKPEDHIEKLEATIKELAATVKGLQDANVKGAQMPSPPDPKEKTLSIIGDFMKSM